MKPPEYCAVGGVISSPISSGQEETRCTELPQAKHANDCFLLLTRMSVRSVRMAGEAGKKATRSRAACERTAWSSEMERRGEWGCARRKEPTLTHENAEGRVLVQEAVEEQFMLPHFAVELGRIAEDANERRLQDVQQLQRQAERERGA